MKRILSILLALVMALGALPAAAFAAEEEIVVTGEENPVMTEGEEVPAAAEEDAAATEAATAGTAEEEAAGGTEDAAAAEDNIVASGNSGDIHWSLDDQGTLTISGQGRVPNYYSTGSGAPWKAGDLKLQIQNLVVEEGITYLGQFAFSDCENLTTVSLPSTLEEIGQQVFQRCSGLLSINIPDSVHTIGKWPFEKCTSLQSVHLPAGIGTHSDVSKRILPEGLFNGCTSLTTVNVPDGVEIIGPLAFCNCASLESIELPETVTALGSNSFSATGLKTLILPDGITSIGEYALLGNTQLTTLKLPANLKTLGNNVLNDSAVTELTIPGGVKIFGQKGAGIFAPAPNLEKLVFEDGVEQILGSFNQAPNLKEIRIPASVTTIDDGILTLVHQDCVIYGDPGSAAETYAAKLGVPFNGRPVPGHTLTLTVQDENGGGVTEGFTVRWYAGDAEAGEGTRLTVTDTAPRYSYELTLGEPLLYDYSQPSRQEVTLAEGDATDVTARLTPLPERTVAGRALDENGAPIGGAKAVFTQNFGGGHTRELTETADETARSPPGSRTCPPRSASPPRGSMTSPWPSRRMTWAISSSPPSPTAGSF